MITIMQLARLASTGLDSDIYYYMMGKWEGATPGDSGPNFMAWFRSLACTWAPHYFWPWFRGAKDDAN